MLLGCFQKKKLNKNNMHSYNKKLLVFLNFYLNSKKVIKINKENFVLALGHYL